MSRFIVITFSVLFFSFAATASTKIPAGLEKLRDVRTQDDKFNKTFREGRDLLEREEWQKAADKFAQLVCDCPEKREVDAAFYWLAFSYKKLGRLNEMNDAISRLRTNFPNSSWVDDAMILQIETRTIASFPSGGGDSIYSSEALALSVTGTTNRETPLDRQEEIRLAAFQSLWENDRNRALEVLGSIVRSGSSASASLKRAMVRSVGSRRFALAYSGPDNFVTAPKVNKTDEKDEAEVRDALIRIYQADADQAVKPDLIAAIANLGGQESIDFLARTYRSESDKAIRKTVLRSLSGYNFQFGFSFSGTGPTNVAIAPGVRGTTSRNPQSKADPQQSPRFKALLEIYRDETDNELRNNAFEMLQTYAGWENAAGVFDGLLREYESSDSEARKTAIITSLGRVPTNRMAVEKLMDIARSDKSDKLRLAAIHALRLNRSPEVAKFLEDLIK